MKGHSVPGKLTTIANSIAQHIQNVTFDKMVPNRMVLNCKIDQHDRLWLMWCSSFRTERKLTKHNPTLYTTMNNATTGMETKEFVVHQEPMRIEMKPSVSTL